MNYYPLFNLEALLRAKQMDKIMTVVKAEEILRKDSYARRRDSYVYLYMDPRDIMRDYKLTEDCTLKYPIVYIGRGTGTRVLDHIITNTNNKRVTNAEFSEWITSLRAQGVEPLVLIYANRMSKAQSEDLEADLIAINKRLQNPYRGLKEYRAVRSPIRSFNKRDERSDQMCYNIATGLRMKRR